MLKAREKRKGYSWSRGFGPAAVLLVLAAALNHGCKKNSDVQGTLEENMEEKNPRSDDELRLQPLPPPDGDDVVVDPFCGLKIRRLEAAATLEHKGVTYYFCTLDHMEAFKKDPEKYLIIDTNDDL